MTSDRARWLLLAFAALVLVGHSLLYNFVTDDAYISFVYSRNFAEHGELAFNLGSPVEGYTSFLWTVILGLGMKVGVLPELASRVLGTACAVVTLVVTFRLMERALGRRTPWAVIPSLLLACSSGYACWSSGGLETQLFTMLVVIAIDGTVAAVDRPRALLGTGVALALAAMTRPEGLLVGGILGLVHLSTLLSTSHRGAWRHAVAAVGLFLVLWAPWFVWRWQYYGYLWPNTYYVKASGPWERPNLPHEMLRGGFYYVKVWLQQTGLLYVLPLAVVGLVVGRRGTPRFALALTCMLLSVSYLSYAITVGGDFMGLHRFIMPVFVTAAIAVVLGLEAVVARTRSRGVAVVACALLIGGFAGAQWSLTRRSLHPPTLDADHGIIDSPAFLIVYTEDRAAIGRAMAPCFRDDDFSIVGGAGAQPYFGRMRAIDVFGLVSKRIAHEAPRVRARAGHTKFATPELLAEYDPTFVFSCYQIHATPAQPVLPCAGFWGRRGYEEVTMHVPGMTQAGTYYTFFAKKARHFECPGRVH